MRKIIPLIVLFLLNAFLTRAQQVSPADELVTLQLINTNKDVIGISSEQISNAKVYNSYEDVATGIRYVGFQQMFKKIPVYNQFLILSFRNGKLVSKAGSFDPEIDRTVNVPSGLPPVTAESAVQSALSDRGFRASQMAIAISRKDNGHFVEFGDMGISSENITARLTWVPNGPLAVSSESSAVASSAANDNVSTTKLYHLAWQVYIVPKTTPDYWMVRVDAVNNNILGMDNYTDYDHWGTPVTDPNVIRYPDFLYGTSKVDETRKTLFEFKKAEDPSVVTTATYRVVPFPAEAPSFPGGAHALRTDPWLAASANAQTLKWNTGAGATDYNYTRGNNVFAYQDRLDDDSGIPADAATSTTALPNLTFDFVPNFTVDPTQTTPVPNQQFNTTNLFYWNNITHDILYAYGFTEAGRNFQDDNLGRGGAGGDWVRAEAQDGQGFNNANFSTPADGSLPRMQMYLWNTATPFLDGDVDNGIIIHEYGHGVSNRSHSGGVGCLTNAERGAEGWSDYLGLMLTQNWATATLTTGFNSPRGIGTYALNQPPTGVGIRPARYTTNFAVNNYTYSNLPSQAIPHGVGFVWCTALWEMTWELINSIGTIEPNIYNGTGTGGNIVALRLVMEGMRTQACQPGFIDARNAILRADTTLFGAANSCAIWRAFARRGMGFGALQGSSASITDQTPSFALPPACNVVAGPTVTINQAAAQPDPTTASPINFTVVFSEAVTGFATGDVTLGGTAGATTAIVTGGPTTFNVAVSGMTSPGTVTAAIPANVCTNAASEPNNASTSTDNTVTYNVVGACGTWAASTVYPIPVLDQAVASVGSNLYSFAGVSNGAVVTSSFKFDGTTWTPILAYPVAVEYPAAASDGTNIFIVGGAITGTGAPQTTMYRYNVAANTYTLMAPCNIATWNPTAVYLNGKIYKFGGTTAVTTVSSNALEIYDIATNTWSAGANMPAPGSFIGGFTDGVFIYACGGLNASGSVASLKTYRYTIATNTWDDAGIADLPATRWGAAYGFISGDGILAGGYVGGNVAANISNTAISWDPASNTWTSLNNLVGERSRFNGAVMGASYYAIGGRSLASAVFVGTNTNQRLTCVVANNPTVTINQAAAQPDPTSVSPINFTAVFNQAVTGFATGDVTLAGTAGATSAVVSGGPTTYNIAVSGMTSSGTVIATIPAGVCTNAALEPNVASTSTDNTVTFNFIPGCTSMNPVPNDSVCNGATHPAINFTSPVPGTIYNWTNSNTSIGLGASGTGNIPAFTATNTTTAPVIATVTVTPSLPVAPTPELLYYKFDGTGTSVPNLASAPPAGTANGTIVGTHTQSGTGQCGSALVGTGGPTNANYMNTGWATNLNGAFTMSFWLGENQVDNSPSYLFGDATAGSFSAYYGGAASPNNILLRGGSADILITGVNPAATLVTIVYNGTNTTIYKNGVLSQTHAVTFNNTSGGPFYIGGYGSGTNSSFSGKLDEFRLYNRALSAAEVGTLNNCTSSACNGNPRTFTITVFPTGQVNAVPNQVVCRGQATAPVNFTSTVPGTIFSWTNNNTSIGLAATGIGNIPSFIAQNPTGVAQVATITVTPQIGPGGLAVTQSFTYTGAVQTWVVPAGVTSISVKAWGAQGNTSASGVAGGLGGYATGTLAVTPGQTLYINVGGGGTTSVTGGFNGGGAAGANAGCAGAQGGGGGGASDVRVGANTLAARAIVGAGGGGAGGNRVAGCGRGAGGGGGGGYYGGGGGAGWPGVPGGQGPVPTGGTQSAGGAGGVTTSTAGATNGLPGSSGVGGAGGIEIGSAQGGSATAEPGGVGGGLTGGPGGYNQVNNWTGQSGAGGSSYIGGVSSGVTTQGLQTGNGRVEFSYVTAGLSCTGTPRTFTITVNPNQDLMIVADPGTTLCEGDPTLLTVYNVGASTPAGTLYTQGGAAGASPNSQKFEPANVAFDNQAAEDFVVPAGTSWTITQVSATGLYFNGAGPSASYNVFFYNNAGGIPGSLIASYTNLPYTGGASPVISIPNTVLGSGTYWISIQANLSFAAGGQWAWGANGTVATGNPWAWQNPGGGFLPPVCTSWGNGAVTCIAGAARNLIFTLTGTSVSPGTIATGTFLWSPALGLSSTTSNPVAASPMNTTTYTVVRTTPAGCQASAQVTITVNKRPVVVTHPASRTNCSGTSATFTVAGTGTGLTYQWQVSPTGCAGPWTNLTNTAPYSGVTTATLTVNPVSTAMNGYAYRVILSGTCTPFVPPTNVSNCAVLSVNPVPNVSISPAGPVCGGVACSFGTQLSVTSTAPPVPGSVTANSGTINLPIPDNTANGVSNTLAIAGVPANATITNISVALNMPHTYPHDMVFNLRGPNGQILSLYKHHTNTTTFPAASIPTAGWYNAIVNNTSTTAFGTVPTPFRYGQTAPSGPYGPDALNGVTSPGYTIMDPTGFVSNATGFNSLYTPGTPTTLNGNWTLAMCDGGPGDLGTLVSWSITIDYTTPGSGGAGALTYVWSPLAGLYTDAAACIPYTGTNTTVVYAAPTVRTVYTVTATNTATGCFSNASVLVNYTPPPPTIVPSPVTMCLGDPAVKLKSSSSQSFTNTFNSGTVNVAIPDGPTIPPVPTSYPATTSNITVSGIPAGATITGVRARFNVTHAYVSDLVMALKAPNGEVINLSALLNRTNQAGANFTNTVISSTGTTALGGAAPYTGTFRADLAGATFTALGFTWPGGPTGYVPTQTTWAPLTPTSASANGVWSIGIYDAGAPDAGVLNNWSLDIDYTVGVVATPAVWTPAAGLYSNAAASIPYVAGTAVDSVWARPTPAGVYPYQATVRGLDVSGATIPLPAQASTLAGNVRGYWFTAPTSFTMTSVEVPTTASTGAQSIAVLRFNGATPPPAFPGTTNAFATLFLTQNNPAAGAIPVNIQINAGDVIGILGYRSNVNSYTANPPNTTVINGTTVNLTRMGMQFPLTTTAPQQIWQEAAFQISRVFFTYEIAVPGCTSPARTVVVTVNQPTSITTQPVAQTLCTDKVATFSVVAAGTGPFSYQWQVSTTGIAGTYTNIANGGVYSGATTATLTITAPPTTMNGYYYRVVINGAAPCAAVTSNPALLTVNPLPVVVISAAPYTSLLPGLQTTLSSTITPNPAATFSWIRNGVVLTNPALGVLSGLGTGTIRLDVDGMGDYQLRVTDVNGCTSTSNTITIKDSASGRCYIYPNPTSGKFQVRYYSTANNVLPRTLTIYDAKGDRVFTQFYQIGRPYDRMDVDMRAYGKGLYWVEIGDLNGNRLTMCRVVIQ